MHLDRLHDPGRVGGLERREEDHQHVRVIDVDLRRLTELAGVLVRHGVKAERGLKGIDHGLGR